MDNEHSDAEPPYCKAHANADTRDILKGGDHSYMNVRNHNAQYGSCSCFLKLNRQSAVVYSSTRVFKLYDAKDPKYNDSLMRDPTDKYKESYKRQLNQIIIYKIKQLFFLHCH